MASITDILDLYRAGRPVTFPDADFKRDYKFIWSFPQAKSGVSDAIKKFADDVKAGTANIGDRLKRSIQTAMGADSGAALVQALFNDDFILCYIAQLAEQVDLPSDDIETENFQLGLVSYPVPSRFTMNPVTVTYVDDSWETVWKFHKTWKESLRMNDRGNVGGFTHFMNPPAKLLRAGRYITFDNTLSIAEYTLMYQALYLGHTVNPGIVNPTTSVDYPGLFPTSIKRTSGNKAGTGIGKVTVTYTRYPVIENAKDTPGKFSGVRSISIT